MVLKNESAGDMNNISRL